MSLLSTVVVLSPHALAAKAQEGAKKALMAEKCHADEVKTHALNTQLASLGTRTLLIKSQGETVYQYGDITARHLIHSIRKAILSSLAMKAIMQGKLNLNATLAEFEFHEKAHLTEQELSATVADVFASRSGIYLPALAESEGMKAKRPTRGAHPPGTHYYYNNFDFNLAGHIVEHALGMTVYDAFNVLIAKPIGLKDYQARFAHFDVDTSLTQAMIAPLDGFYLEQEGRSPAYHFRLSTRDLARFGELMASGGLYQGKRILDAKLIEQFTSPYTVTNPKYRLGYGMLWGVVLKEEGQPHHSFYHTGIGRHMLGVYPNKDLVFAHTVASEQSLDGSAIRFKPQSLYQVIPRVHGFCAESS